MAIGVFSRLLTQCWAGTASPEKRLTALTAVLLPAHRPGQSPSPSLQQRCSRGSLCRPTVLGPDGELRPGHLEGRVAFETNHREQRLGGAPAPARKDPSQPRRASPRGAGRGPPARQPAPRARCKRRPQEAAGSPRARARARRRWPEAGPARRAPA